MASVSTTTRIASLDQFRGYTVLGMFFVNFASHFLAYPDVSRHHRTYCSYADTIMPHFFFAVGFAYRLTFVKRLESDGFWTAYGRVLRRNLGLILFALIYHGFDGGAKTWSDLQKLGLDGFFRTGFQRDPFQTLTHIGVTALWIMPVIGARPIFRIMYGIGSCVLFWYLSQDWYYAWVMKRPGIDGGPLGFMTWTVPMLVGSLAYDAFVGAAKPPFWKFLGWAGVLMLIGYGLSCLNRILAPGSTTWFVEPPFVPPSQPVDLWTMSQRSGSPSYLVFGAGFSLAVYAFFALVCDRYGLSWGFLATFGTNALAAYIIHDIVGKALGPFAPKDAPLWYAVTAFIVFTGLCYVFLRHLEKHRLFLRL